MRRCRALRRWYGQHCARRPSQRSAPLSGRRALFRPMGRYALPVYAGYKGQNDLSDDINVRSRTINYLSGGSVFNPKEPGLGVPLEMSMALHSDAGFRTDDRIVGTLGIYTTHFNDGKLAAGTNRYASRDLATCSSPVCNRTSVPLSMQTGRAAACGTVTTARPACLLFLPQL